MSWRATAWAEQQVTGAPSRKLTLMILANYADDQGWCYPSQKTISKGSEQSQDTVQRNIRRLHQDGFIATISKRQRFGGRWPGYLYRLNLPWIDRASTEPQALRRGRAAPAPSTEPQALRYEPLNNKSSEPPFVPQRTAHVADSQRTSGERRARPEIIQHRVALRLGAGDAEQGWIVFGSLPTHVRVQLEDLERRGELTEDVLTIVRSERALSEAGGPQNV